MSREDQDGHVARQMRQQIAYTEAAIQRRKEAGYVMAMARTDDRVVIMRRDKARVEVRGKPHYATHGHDANDTLHQFLDAIDPATVSSLFTYELVRLNPTSSRSWPTFDVCDTLFQEGT